MPICHLILTNQDLGAGVSLEGFGQKRDTLSLASLKDLMAGLRITTWGHTVVAITLYWNQKSEVIPLLGVPWGLPRTPLNHSFFIHQTSSLPHCVPGAVVSADDAKVEGTFPPPGCSQAGTAGAPVQEARSKDS